MFALERANTTRRIRWWTVLGLILIPLVVAGGFLAATWKSTDRLDRVQAAVVNLDEPVTLNKQLVPLGRQFAGGLVSSKDPNFSWLLTDSTDAADGLASGRYAAVLTIPKSFSANATSYSKNDADVVKPATIDVQTSQVTGIADPVVGQAAAAAATRILNTQLTESYLKNVYIGFNTTAKQFGTLASAAGKLSDGTGQLSGGLTKTADGTGQLASGLDQLGDGAGQLADGASQLSTGTGQLANGLDQLASGAHQSAKGAKKLADGTDKSASGAKKLAKGTATFSAGLDQAAAGAKTYAKGSRSYAAGQQQYSAGVDKYAAGAAQFAGGMKQFQQGIQGLAADGIPCPEAIPAAECPIFQAGVKAGAGAALQGLDGTDQQPGLVAGAQGLSSGANALSSGARKLSGGAGQLAGGATKLSGGLTKLAKGGDGIADGTHQFASGLGKLAGGTDQLATGLGKLADGTSKSASGAHQLASGASQLSDGTSQLAGGAQDSATGAGKLSQGLDKLSTGGEKLASGTKKFADGLDKGKGKIPTYTSSDRNRLSAVVSAPVTAPKVDKVFSDVATTTYLAVIALWIGALASYLVLRAVSARVLASRKSSWRLALDGLLPGAVIAAVQAVALTVVLQLLLDLSATRVVALLAFALLVGLSFVAVNQALVAWFGGVGRFISVLFVVIAAAGAITSAVPAVFDDISPFVPLTPALQGVRAIVTGGSGGSGAAALLVAWLLIGVVATILAVARRRTVSPLAPVPLPA